MRKSTLEAKKRIDKNKGMSFVMNRLTKNAVKQVLGLFNFFVKQIKITKTF